MNEVLVRVFDPHLVRRVDGTPRYCIGILRRVAAPLVFRSTDIVCDLTWPTLLVL